MLTGGCLCGALRYEADGEPLGAGFCHCRNCQRATGTGHACYLSFPLEAVTIRGATVVYAAGKEGDARRPVRHFCPTCGSTPFGTPLSAPGMVNLYAGTLDDPSLFRPTAAIFTRDRPDWDRPAIPLDEHPGHPADADGTGGGSTRD